jgi:hypothetical protein
VYKRIVLVLMIMLMVSTPIYALEWQAVNYSNPDMIKESGLTVAEFNDLSQSDWLELLNNKDKVNFAFSATNSNGEDVTNNVNPDLSIYVNGLNGNQTVRFGEVDLGENTIAAGYHHSLALKDDGTLVSWGRDNFNQVSNTPAGNFKLP